MNTVKIFRPFTILQIPQMEVWIKKQSEKGLKLIAYKHGWFTFMESQKRAREYFIYKSPLVDNKEPFLTDFFTLKRLYGKRKSALNKASCCIVEVDEEKSTLDYRHFLLARNDYYQKHNTKLLIVMAILDILFSVMLFFSVMALMFLIMCVLPTIYFCISLFVLKHQKRVLIK